MRISDLRAMTVTVPPEAPLRQANGCQFQLGPGVRYASEVGIHLTDDIIEGGPMRYGHGAIRVPQGPD